MKIICIENNTKDTVFYTKPDTALYIHKHPFYLPLISTSFTGRIQLIVRVNRVGKSIPQKFASRYYSEIGVGINLVAEDVKSKLTAKNLVWNAHLFDNSTIPSSFTKLSNNVDLSFSLNGVVMDEFKSVDVLSSVDKYISDISEFVTFKIGDLLIVDVANKNVPVKETDMLTGYVNGNKLLDIAIN